MDTTSEIRELEERLAQLRDGRRSELVRERVACLQRAAEIAVELGISAAAAQVANGASTWQGKRERAIKALRERGAMTMRELCVAVDGERFSSGQMRNLRVVIDRLIRNGTVAASRTGHGGPPIIYSLSHQQAPLQVVRGING
jgi:uncharacterized membrane-anchored protein